MPLDVQAVPGPPVPLKKRVQRAAHDAMQLSGLAHLWTRRGEAGGAAILAYHSVAPDEQAPCVTPAMRVAPALFRRQMEFLARRRNVVTVDDVVTATAEGRTLPAGSVAITFDDGYLDNLTVAAPVMSELGIPSTWYLATGFTSGEDAPWADRLHTAFVTRTRHEFSFGDATYRLDDPAALRAAFTAVNRSLVEQPLADREPTLTDLVTQLKPAVSPPRLLMTWDEVREARRTHPLVEFGVHSRNHIDLSRHLGNTARAEIQQSIEDYESELGERPRHFAFPYDRHAPESRQMVADAGLRSAMGVCPEPLVRPGHDLFALPRVMPHPERRRFAFHTSGAHPGLARAIHPKLV